MMIDKRKWTRRKFDSLVTGLTDSGGWFSMHRALIQKLGLEAAATLHYLIDFHGRVQRSPKYKWNEGWFFCTVDKMHKEIGLSPKAQTRVLTALSEVEKDGDDPILEFQKKGLPARRHIRIDCEVIGEIITGWVEKGVNSDSQMGVTGETQMGVTYPYYTKTDRKSNMGRKASRSPGKGFTLEDFHIRGAEHLKTVLIAYDSDLVQPPRKVRTDTLAKSLFRLDTERKVPRSEIKGMVKWLKEHYGDEFTPKLRKADDLFTKWEQFRGAKLRWDSDQQKSNGEPEMTDNRMKTIVEIQNRLEAKGEYFDDGPIDPKELAKVLEEMGLPEGAFGAHEI